MSDESQPKPTRKQQQRSVITQQKLLDAAIEAFSENGFKGTSTRDIAERAGVHHPLITYHFKNKDQLWQAAAGRVVAECHQALQQALSESIGMDPKSQMVSMIRAYVYYCHQAPALHKIIMQESSYPNPRLEWLVETHTKPFYEGTLKQFGHLQDLGVAPAGSPGLLFNMIRVSAGAMQALGLEIKAVTGIDLEAEETLNELVDILVRLFLPGDLPT